jgi:hypothetical protein
VGVVTASFGAGAAVFGATDPFTATGALGVADAAG